ncbi:MAG: alpha-ketoglutarate-dependent dioxygenase AlkB [Cryomorphaceae bacterium]|jgi:alkylated DNA repair dioxygenase AlkB|nr:alpha-ketoglutarate-dependent dioxygenase AlkB [Cryomorphaceae bacterium]
MEFTEVQNGWVALQKSFISSEYGNQVFTELKNSLDWEQGNIVLFGKKHLIPRMESFHSMNGQRYGYSGKSLKISPFNELLLDLKARIELVSNHSFNSVLINLYRNGMDSNGWHSDNEKELGLNPVIASLSIGTSRMFQLKHIESKERIQFELSHGDLLLMGGELQHFWKHQVPKQPKIKEARINLTFRKIDIHH